jgi:hypothetical protein
MLLHIFCDKVLSVFPGLSWFFLVVFLWNDQFLFGFEGRQ